MQKMSISAETSSIPVDSGEMMSLDVSKVIHLIPPRPVRNAAHCTAQNESFSSKSSYASGKGHRFRVPGLFPGSGPNKEPEESGSGSTI
jgi:hypothetical protein